MIEKMHIGYEEEDTASTKENAIFDSGSCNYRSVAFLLKAIDMAE